MTTRATSIKRTKKGPAPEKFYAETFQYYYLHTYNSLDQNLISRIKPEGAEVMPTNIFLGTAEGKSLYYNPVPRNLAPVFKFIANVHEQIISEMRAQQTTTITALLTIPETPNVALARVDDPKGIMTADISSRTVGARVSSAAEATMAMNRIVKSLVWTLMTFAGMGGRVSVQKPYLVQLCSFAHAPPSLLLMAQRTEEEVARAREQRRKKAPAAATAATTGAAPTDTTDAHTESDESAEGAEDAEEGD